MEAPAAVMKRPPPPTAKKTSRPCCTCGDEGGCCFRCCQWCRRCNARPAFLDLVGDDVTFRWLNVLLFSWVLAWSIFVLAFDAERSLPPIPHFTCTLDNVCEFVAVQAAAQLRNDSDVEIEILLGELEMDCKNVPPYLNDTVGICIAIVEQYGVQIIQQFNNQTNALPAQVCAQLHLCEDVEHPLNVIHGAGRSSIGEAPVFEAGGYGGTLLKVAHMAMNYHAYREASLSRRRLLIEFDFIVDTQALNQSVDIDQTTINGYLFGNAIFSITVFSGNSFTAGWFGVLMGLGGAASLTAFAFLLEPYVFKHGSLVDKTMITTCLILLLAICFLYLVKILVKILKLKWSNVEIRLTKYRALVKRLLSGKRGQSALQTPCCCQLCLSVSRAVAKAEQDASRAEIFQLGDYTPPEDGIVPALRECAVSSAQFCCGTCVLCCTLRSPDAHQYYETRDDFFFPQRLLMALASTTMIGTFALALAIVIKAELIAMLLVVLPEVVPYPSTVVLVVNIVHYALPGVAAFSTFCTVIAFAFVFSQYRRDIMNMRRGRYPFNRRSYVVVWASNYVGYQFVHAVASWLLIFTSLLAVVTPIVVVLAVSAPARAWVVMQLNGLTGYLITSAVVLRVASFILPRLFFMSQGALTNRWLFSLYDFFYMFAGLVTGLFVVVARLILAILFELFFFIRLDKSLFPRGWESFDPGYASYVAMLLMDHQQNNPILRVAGDFFIDSLERRRMRAKSLASEPAYFSKTRGYVMTDVNDKETEKLLGEKGVSINNEPPPLPPLPAVHLQVRNRWALAVTLARNPALRMLRKSVLAAAEDDFREMAGISKRRSVA